MKVGDLVRVKDDHQFVAIVLSVESAHRWARKNIKVCYLDGLIMTHVLDPFDPCWEVISESR
jgi:hypothetical protein